MQIFLENTTRLIDVNGIKARLWEGETKSGIPIHCLIIRIAVNKEANQEEFERELKNVSPPSAASEQAFPSSFLMV